MLGEEAEFPWPEIFDRGSVFSSEAKYPNIAKMKAVWKDISEKLYAAVEKLSTEELTKELPYNYPHNDNTVSGVLQFIMFHETYHVGKISLLRSSLGYEGLIK